MIGLRTGKCVVLKESVRDRRGIVFLCQCDCGKTFERPGRAIRAAIFRGHVVSCGCVKIENMRRVSKSCVKHGLTKSPIYNAWVNMHQRCYNTNAQQFPLYGARGIKVCDEWHDSSAFIAWARQGYAPGLSLGRIDNSGDYEPSNCRWETWFEQQSNRRSNTMHTIEGRTQCLSQWAREFGKTPDQVYGRIAKGWSIDDALAKPIDTRFHPQKHCESLT